MGGKTKMIKVIIFDTDGMVVNSEMFSVQYNKDYGIPMDSLLPFFKNEFQPCLIGTADLKEEIKDYLPKWGWKDSVDSFLKYWFDAENHVDKRVVEAINKLRNAGFKCYLATNQEKYRTEYLRNEMGFGEIFDKVFSSAEVGYKKPQQEFFEFVLNDIKLNKDEVQFWDDTDKNVEGAREFGFDANLYRDFDKFALKLKELDIEI